IPYELHVDREAYYHSLLYAVMQLLGFNIEAEVSVSGGRVDGILELPNAVYVMEVKYRRHEGEGVLEDALKECFAQIEARGYCARYAGSGKTVYKTAVAVAGRGEVRVKHEKETSISPAFI
ncbi:MAG: PD-(D/E)XK nuclease domain-containing protein, partial [Clostridiales bacterium]|nr:PD-(D/E)XK nuclease domain-containing protein [Clostridiales bacterium]